MLYVKRYYGTDVSRLTIKSWGETKPLADNNTSEGQAANRRIDL